MPLNMIHTYYSEQLCQHVSRVQQNVKEDLLQPRLHSFIRQSLTPPPPVTGLAAGPAWSTGEERKMTAERRQRSNWKSCCDEERKLCGDSRCTFQMHDSTVRPLVNVCVCLCVRVTVFYITMSSARGSRVSAWKHVKTKRNVDPCREPCAALCNTAAGTC